MNSNTKNSLIQTIENELIAFNAGSFQLPGIDINPRRNVLARQIVDSIRRVEFVYQIANSNISNSRRDPTSDAFDPIRAAILFQREGEIGEAFWLIFLAIHFGKHGRSHWRLARDVYGGLGGSIVWSWANVEHDILGFLNWLSIFHALNEGDDIERKFGNHRRYESLNPTKNRNLGQVVQSYVDFIHGYGSHADLIDVINSKSGGDPRKAFDILFKNLKIVSFARLAKFDYLSMLAKVGLISIEPGTAYLAGSTGPLSGAKLLFQGGNQVFDRATLDSMLVRLGNELSIGRMQMQVVEDAICNWQKSPNKYTLFMG